MTVVVNIVLSHLDDLSIVSSVKCRQVLSCSPVVGSSVSPGSIVSQSSVVGCLGPHGDLRVDWVSPVS